MTSARSELWARAAALSEGAGAGISLRARRLSARRDGALTVAEIARAPDWIVLAVEDRAALARLTGAAAVSHAWRRTIDGATLRTAAASLGEAALDALLALPDVMAPQVTAGRAASGDGQALERLGGALLVAEGGFPDSLRPRLARALAPTDAPPCPPEVASRARRTAEAVQAQLAAGRGA